MTPTPFKMVQFSEDSKEVTVTIGLLRYAALALIVTTFTVTTVYWNFGVQSREVEFLKEKMEYERDRTDRKVNPIKGELEALKTELMLEKIEILKIELEAARNANN